MQTRSCLGLMVLALLLSVSSCRSLPVDQRQLFLPNGEAWQLRAPSDYGSTVVASQKISAQFDGQSIVMMMQLEIDADSTRLAAINPTLVSLFSLRDDGYAIESDVSPLVPKQLDPKYVLADIQLVYWPLEKLQPSLRIAGLRLIETYDNQSPENSSRQRSLLNSAGEILVYIIYKNNHIEFDGRARDYRYQIETLSWDTE